MVGVLVLVLVELRYGTGPVGGFVPSSNGLATPSSPIDDQRLASRIAHSERLSDELKICSFQASIRPTAACRRVMISHQLHMRRDSACLQQHTDVARIAGQHDVRWSGQQRHVRVDDIGRASLREQLAYPLAVIAAQCFDSHTCQYSCEIGLLAAITPDLTDNRGTRTQRRPLLLEHAQLSTCPPVTPVDGDQRSGIEYRLHATSGRRARPSRDAAASSSASVKEPSSDSQASKASPSSSFLSLSAAASLSQADTLIPCRSAALRTPSPRSGGIVTENLSTCAMHTIISHTLILNSVSTAAHPAVVHLIQQPARLVSLADCLAAAAAIAVRQPLATADPVLANVVRAEGEDIHPLPDSTGRRP
jgi:hypothetical protein